MGNTVTAIVVSFADPVATRKALGSLLEQTHTPVELLVVDNGANYETARALAAASPSCKLRVLRPRTNLGYTGAVNLAAEQATGDWLFLLNPDALAADDCLERLLGAVDGPDVAIVGAQVLLPDGRVNAGENPVNIAGISWSGGYGLPREHGPAHDTAAVSGAALLVRREAFEDVGGLCPFFFMYVDDVDLAWRVRLRGLRVRYCPAATVVHDYQFQKGPHKWFYLERNRAWALLSNLRLGTLTLLAPMLVATEAIVSARAFSERWLGEKAKAWASLLRQTPQLVRWRRSVQARRVVSDYEVVKMFSAGIETDLIATRIPAWMNRWVGGYRDVVLWGIGLRKP